LKLNLLACEQRLEEADQHERYNEQQNDSGEN
jgi:hypothetical protein